jgi:hypothetical protein
MFAIFYMFAFYCSQETRLILLPGRLRIFCDGVVASFLVGLAMSGWSLAESEEGSVASSWGIAASPSEPQPSSSCSAACAGPKGPSLAAALTSFFGESWPPPHELASTSGPPRDRSRSPLDPVLIRSCSAGPSARWKLLLPHQIPTKFPPPSHHLPTTFPPPSHHTPTTLPPHSHHTLLCGLY